MANYEIIKQLIDVKDVGIDLQRNFSLKWELQFIINFAGCSRNSKTIKKLNFSEII